MAIQQVEVNVLKKGRKLKSVLRPVRVVSGRRYVTYKGHLYPLLPGLAIEIDAASMAQEVAAAPCGVAAATELAAEGRSGPERREAKKHASCDTPHSWDKDQLAVIEAPIEARLLVSAGPGTGKTAVACRRVAELIDSQGVSPANVWLISFTRTAVQEIRNRLASFLRTPSDAYTVRIATIDSHAWAIQSGFDSTASLTGTYEDNIECVNRLVRSNEGVFEYLESVEHLIVDEAQDIVGPRAGLILAVLETLRAGCGVTIFADEAQAIYGFADDNGNAIAQGRNLSSALRALPSLRFENRSLSIVYRANTDQVRTLFTQVRERVLSPDVPGAAKLESVRELVEQLADEHIMELDSGGDFDESTFLLFRRRADALVASAYRGWKSHRIRISGFPVTIEPWVGALLWDFTERHLTRVEFDARWDERIARTDFAAPSAEVTWNHLVRISGESNSRIALPLLRARLARKSPPLELSCADFGFSGPVMGTIHGCKGREAEHVVLMIPANAKSSARVDHEEEARVIFVGATRARLHLKTVPPYRSMRARVLKPSGRAFTLQTRTGQLAAQVEIGRESDLSAEGVVGRANFPDASDVMKAQRWMIEHARQMGGADARTNSTYSYRVFPRGSDICVAHLHDVVNRDLFDIGKRLVEETGAGKIQLKPHTRLSHLRLFGARTLVLPVESERARFHEPWATSGFMLAPMVQGFVMTYFSEYTRSHERRRP